MTHGQPDESLEGPSAQFWPSAPPKRPLAAPLSLLLLVTVATVKTMLTKLIFLHVPTPVAYSLLSASVTGLLVVPLIYASAHGAKPHQPSGLRCVRPYMLLRLSVVCVAVAIDLGLSNVAIWLLPLALQQMIASTIPAATISLESLYRRRLKPLVNYLIIATLCTGAILGHAGSTATPQKGGEPAAEIASRSRLGEIAMVGAIFAAACKYVFAKATIACMHA